MVCEGSFTNATEILLFSEPPLLSSLAELANIFKSVSLQYSTWKMFEYWISLNQMQDTINQGNFGRFWKFFKNIF